MKKKFEKVEIELAEVVDSIVRTSIDPGNDLPEIETRILNHLPHEPYLIN